METIGVGEFALYGKNINRNSKRWCRKNRRIMRAFKEKERKVKVDGVEKKVVIADKHVPVCDARLVKTDAKKFKLHLTYEIEMDEIHEKNAEKVKRFDSVAIDPGNRTFLSMYSGEGFAGSIGSGDMSKIYQLLSVHDKLMSHMMKGGRALNHDDRIKLARIRERVRNLRDDVQWQSISFLLQNFKNIFIPKLDVKHLVMKGQRNLNKKATRQMLCWAHGKFTDRLLEKAKEYPDTNVIIVDECYTSKSCGGCGAIYEINSGKYFQCRECPFRCERDINGARNIYIKLVAEGVVKIN
jgi:transposase